MAECIVHWFWLIKEQVEAKNLNPYTTYYYQFNVCGSDNKSPMGRTKTSPNADDDITEVSLAIYSCSNFPFGFFNAYGNPVRKVRVLTLKVQKRFTDSYTRTP
jgi:phosphodiesterase/alkaline phosphatase D-like protein